MKRLFISLYLLLSLSFIGIGWTLDSLWQNHVDDSGDVDAPLIAFAILLSKSPEKQRLALLNLISQQVDFPLQLLERNQIALHGNMQLSPNKIITTQADDEHQLQFIAVDEQVLMAGPIDIDPRGKLRNIFTIIFYISLALVALIWVWPLSRDLNTLRVATRKFGEANWGTRIELSPSSQVAPLALTFNDMAQHISSLIDNQKHLTNAVSHEIRTPLARLKFALALLPQYCLPETSEQKRVNFLNDMHSDIKEMEDLLQELLTYASLETMHIEPILENCELVSISKEMISRLSDLSRIKINFQHDELDEIFIKGEGSLVERALQNLITNSQRYAKQQIDVTLTRDKNKVYLAVSNDGPSIPVEDQPHIFEAFYRSKLQHLGNKGHGLGLAIIKRIMLRHKGDVSVFSDNNKTEFTLSWPVIP
ncbi:ATP-binding protein [Shewanella aestuarii]|uniref:histidine kinase n=1 Tax=Shewanella aestuarii TaxID=1028752 RepID=A0A6G9QH87_9GAMM|nr:ATP-binding protein [Shewanella aestuarii]QIR13758.1 GHKL domain-containing protein [Shewanella aestuarii]